MQDNWFDIFPRLLGLAHAEVCYGCRLGAKEAWSLAETLILLMFPYLHYIYKCLLYFFLDLLRQMCTLMFRM